MRAAFFIRFYGSQGSVGTFVECTALRSDLQHDRLRSSGEWDRYVCLPARFHKVTYTGSMMCFPIHKGYYGKSAHHKGVSSLNDFYVLKLIHPRLRDALGLSTLYPRPVEFKHCTIPYMLVFVKVDRQHIRYQTRITVYPFTLYANG